jgi:hypothetical protein
MMRMRRRMRIADVAHAMGRDIFRRAANDFAAHGLVFLLSVIRDGVVKDAIIDLEGGGAHEASAVDENVLWIMLLTDVAEAAIFVPVLDDTNFGHIAEVRVFGFTGEWLVGRCE